MKYQSVTGSGQLSSLGPRTFVLEQDFFMYFLTWWLNIQLSDLGLAIMNIEMKLGMD